MLDVAALDAVTQWQFTPVLVNGTPVPVMMTVTVNFKLDAALRPPTPPHSSRAYAQYHEAAGTAAAAARPAASPPPPNALRVGGKIAAPRKITDVKAVYPEEARAAKVQGVVIIEVLIGPDGTVQDAKVLRGIPLLDQAALDAVRQWVFTPTLVNGVAVPVIVTMTVNFTLR